MADDVLISIGVEANNTQKVISDLKNLENSLRDIIAGGGKVEGTFKEIASEAGRFGSSVKATGASVENASKQLGTLRTSAAALRREYQLLAAANPGASAGFLQSMFGADKVNAIRDAERAIGADPIRDADNIAATEARAQAQIEAAIRQKARAQSEYSHQAVNDAERVRQAELDGLRRVIEKRAEATRAQADYAHQAIRDAERVQRIELEALRRVMQERARIAQMSEKAEKDISGANADIEAQKYERLLASMSPIEAMNRRMADATTALTSARARESAATANAANTLAAHNMAIQRSGKGSIEAAEAGMRHAAAQREVAEAMRATNAATSTLNRMMTTSAGAIRGMSDDAQNAEVRVQALQYALFYTSATLGAMAAVGVRSLKSVFSTMIEVESQFAQVNRTVEDYTTVTRDALQGISRDIPVAIEDIAEIAALGGALNINAKNIVAFTTTVSKLTATTNLTEQAAGNLIGRMDALLDLDEEGGDFEKIGAAVLSVGAQSAATESAVASMAAQVAGLGKNVGLTAPQIIGWSGALASVGISAELGRSALQRIFNILNRDVRRGGTELEILGRITGQTGLEFKKSLGTDASGALLDFVAGIRDLTKSGQDSIQTLNALGFRNVRDIYTLQQLAAAYENTEASLRNADDAFNDSARTMDRYYGPIAATTAARVQKLQSAWTLFLNNLGSSSQGPFNEIVNNLTKLVTGIDEFVRENPKVASMIVNFIAMSAALLILTGLFAQLGSSAANFFFVQQQLKAVLDGFNAATLPTFIRNILIKTRVLDADTVATQLNAAAAAKGAAANTAMGNSALLAAGKISKAVVKAAGWAAILATLAAVGNIVINVLTKTDESFESIFQSIGAGDPIIAGATDALLNLSLRLIEASEGYYNLRGWMDDNLWNVENRNDNDPVYQDLMNRKRVTQEALAGLKDGMDGVTGPIEEAEVAVNEWGESMDDATLQAAIMAGQTEYLTEDIESIPKAAIEATEAIKALTESMAEATGEYTDLSAVLERTIVIDPESDLGIADILKAPGEDLMSQILGGMTSSNEAARAFQEDLTAIATSGGLAMADALAGLGVEKAAGIAKALIGNPELQRQFQIQARIAGLLSNKEFLLAFQEGAGNEGISDALAKDIVGISGDLDMVYKALEASSFGAGSAQWEEFVRGWNAAYPENPLVFGAFELAEGGAKDIVDEFMLAVRNEIALNTYGPVAAEVPIEPNFLFDMSRTDPTRYAALIAPVVAGLQEQLNQKTLTPPMAFDTIAVTNGYESWQSMVEANPTLAAMDPYAPIEDINQVIGEIKSRLWAAAYAVGPKADPNSIANIISSIRTGLRNAAFSVDVRGNVRPVLQQGKVGVYANRHGGHIGSDGVGRFATGGGWGLVGGRGTGTSDSNLSWLSRGEYVQPAASTSHYGVNMMDAIRARQFPTVDQFAAMLQSAAAVSGNSGGPQSVTNVNLVQNYPQTVNPLQRLREDSENLVAGLWG